MRGQAKHCGPRRRQSGATAVEFALIFPMLLTVMYSGVVYSYVFMLQQAINFAAQQGVQAAVAVLPQTDSGTTLALRKAQAQQAALSSLSWLPGDQLTRVAPTSVTTCGTGQSVPSNGYGEQVTFSLSGGSGGSLFPTLVSLPLVGSVPVLPATLTACAVALT